MQHLDWRAMTDGPIPTASPTLRRLLAVAALLGLFAVHGLVPHGSVHADRVADALSAASTSSHHLATAVLMGESDVAVVTIADGDDGTPVGALVGLAGMCVAVLLIGLVLTVRLRGGLAVGGSARASVQARAHPPRARRDPDPPRVLALSIQRC